MSKVAVTKRYEKNDSEIDTSVTNLQQKLQAIIIIEAVA